MMAAADRAHRAQVRLDAEAERNVDRICVAMTAALGRSVPRTEAVKAALRFYCDRQIGDYAPRKEQTS
jgi:hypothetical protein